MYIAVYDLTRNERGRGNLLVRWELVNGAIVRMGANPDLADAVEQTIRDHSGDLPPQEQMDCLLALVGRYSYLWVESDVHQ